MLLKNTSVFFGKELKFIENTSIRLTTIFEKIKPGLSAKASEKIIDCEGLVVLPGFVNAHTHIGDSIAKDITLNKTVDEKIHPVVGAKTKILNNTKSSQLSSFMKNSCISMLQKGITTFIDFREGGSEGIVLLQDTLSKIPIRCIILGRINYYQNKNQILKNISLPDDKQIELNEISKNSDGIGISGANEFSNSCLEKFSKLKKIRAIHSSETIQSVNRSKNLTNKTETCRALLLKPHFLIHMTHASKNDLFKVAKKTRGIVVCPRANATLSEGIPDINLMLRAGCNIAIGTDNVMINSTDMFREMDYLWNVSMGLSKKRIDPRVILKMATVNGGRLLDKKIGVIETKAFADCIFIDKHSIDLEPMHNPHASIVHRASQNSIKAVMIGGKFVHGKI